MEEESDASRETVQEVVNVASNHCINVPEMERPLLEHNANDDDDEPPPPPQQIATVESPATLNADVALGWSPTTPVAIKWCIPLTAILISGLFYYGQSSNMWKLTCQYHVSISYVASSMETRLLLDALQLPLSNTIHIKDTTWDIQYFTYSYWVKQLWLAQGMPHPFFARLASLGLVLCSGIWPHLKLLLLLLLVWLVRCTRERTRYLHWLSVLGKWSLVDVFVVCVLVGVLHLQWQFVAETALQQLLLHWDSVLPILRVLYSTTDLCTMAMHFDCHTPNTVIHSLDCQACARAVNRFLAHPSPILNGLTLSGGGHGSMVVKGLHGIYAFCGAVVASILLGAIVDLYHLKQQSSLSAVVVDSTSVVAPHIDDDSDNSLDDQEQPLLVVDTRNDPRTGADRLYDEQRLGGRPRFRIEVFDGVLWSFFSLVVLALVLFASFTVTLERRVFGVLPNLLEDLLGVVWEEPYSFVHLGWTMRGGWDYLLMGTFCSFMVLGPILRSVLCTIASCIQVGGPNARVQPLYTVIDMVGAFCAWEVFAAAAAMVALVMPDMTATIIMDPRCQLIAQDSESNCLEVELDLNRFWKVIVSGILLFLVSQHARYQTVPR